MQGSKVSLVRLNLILFISDIFHLSLQSGQHHNKAEC